MYPMPPPQKKKCIMAPENRLYSDDVTANNTKPQSLKTDDENDD